MRRHQNRRILIVEDQPLIAMTEKKHLENIGYSIVLANSGEEAVDIIKADDSIHLILMDIDLGDGIDGVEAGQIISKLRQIPLVFLSSHTEPEIVLKTENVTSYGYVVKNSGLTVLDASIQMAFKLFEANQRLTESEEKFRSVFESANAGKSITRLSGEIFVNQALCDMLGYDQDELIGVKWEELTVPEEIENSRMNVQLLLSGKEDSVRFRKRYIHKNGNHIWADASLALKRNSQGEPMYILTTLIDITEQVQLEKKLQENNEKLKLIFDKAVTAIVLLKFPERIIVDVNEEAERLTGYSKAELIGKTPMDFGMAEEDERTRALRKIQEQGSLHRESTFIYDRNRKRHEILANSTLISFGGNSYVLTTMIDVSLICKDCC